MGQGKKYAVLKELRIKYNVSLSNLQFSELVSKDLNDKITVDDLYKLCKKYELII